MKRYLKTALVAVFLLALIGLLALSLAGKYDLVWFSLTHPEQARFAMDKYNAVHKIADEAFFKQLR